MKPVVACPLAAAICATRVSLTESITSGGTIPPSARVIALHTCWFPYDHSLPAGDGGEGGGGDGTPEQLRILAASDLMIPWHGSPKIAVVGCSTHEDFPMQALSTMASAP